MTSSTALQCPNSTIRSAVEVLIAALMSFMVVLLVSVMGIFVMMMHGSIVMPRLVGRHAMVSATRVAKAAASSEAVKISMQGIS